MKRLVLSLILLTTASSTGLAQESEARKPAPKPLRALLIAGGCCHDYAAQQKAICEGIQARAYVRVDVYWTDNSSTAPVFPLYKRLNWAEEYDVIIHDECAAAVKDQAMVNRIYFLQMFLGNVRIYLRGGDVNMSEHYLNCP